MTNPSDTRNGFIQINVEFKRLLSDKAEIVNVGEAPNDLTGDLLTVALGKIIRNLAKL